MQGRQFDKDGNLVEWWEPETKEAYLKKASCIIHQYGNYTAEQVGLNVSICDKKKTIVCNNVYLLNQSICTKYVKNGSRVV